MKKLWVLTMLIFSSAAVFYSVQSSNGSTLASSLARESRSLKSSSTEALPSPTPTITPVPTLTPAELDLSREIILDPDGDYDGDGVKNRSDNCLWTYNPDQKDSNKNGIGDACEGKNRNTKKIVRCRGRKTDQTRKQKQ